MVFDATEGNGRFCRIQCQRGKETSIPLRKDSESQSKEQKQVQHCTNLPLQVTSPAHSELGKTGPRVRVNVIAHREKKENEKTGKTDTE